MGWVHDDAGFPLEACRDRLRVKMTTEEKENIAVGAFIRRGGERPYIKSIRHND